MKKFDIFTRSPRARKYKAAGYVLALDIRQALLLGARFNQNKFVKALPAIYF